LFIPRGGDAFYTELYMFAEVKLVDRCLHVFQNLGAFA
jgi:hypothetical protein